MLKIFLGILICLLASYGALSLIIGVANSIYGRTKGRDSKIRLVLVIKNQAEAIEGIIRNIFNGDVLGKAMSDGCLMVVDMGSTDETMSILMKLRDDYECIDIFKQDEKEKIFESFEENN